MVREVGAEPQLPQQSPDAQVQGSIMAEITVECVLIADSASF